MNKPYSLSEYEMNVATDKDFLFTKTRIIEKVYDVFGKLANEFAVHLNHSFQDIEAGTPKISKGENYKGLPYVILDYPRIFHKEDILAVRCFFWWGNFFSITLQLSGKYKDEYETALQQAINADYFQGWYISVADNEWEHHFETDNYALINSNLAYTLADRSFIKLAKKIPLVEWDNAENFFIENFQILLKAISNQAPIR